MASLSNKAENALNETRMLVLGAQVLIGFNFQAAFQSAFKTLPAAAQRLELLGLGLMLIALGLLIAPSAFHQIAECGNDTPRLIDYTGRIASLALLPFALGIGLEVYLVALVIIGEPAARVLGGVGTLFALLLWYGLNWLWRARDVRRGTQQQPQRMSEPTSIESRIKQVLTEARVVLPGAQALLGFQLAATLTDAFGSLPMPSKLVHMGSLILMAVAIVFLMAPASFHRIVEQGEDTERLYRFSSAMVVGAMIPIALGLAGDFYVVAAKILESPPLAIGLAVASLAFFFVMWFGVTLAVRARRDTRRGRLSVSRAVR